MSLPAPNLDDRRFQDIVDDAKRRITRHCPEWTDHNVSDPGVALIELFAWMTEMMLYRVNQVPDRLYVKFLELVGIELFTAAPARTDVLFSLAAITPEPVRVPAGTQVGTDRSEHDDQIVFMTDEDLILVQPDFGACLSRRRDGYEDHTEDLLLEGATVALFPSLRPGDALYLGYRNSLASNMIRLDVTVSETEGAGIEPGRPPRVWQTWTGNGWENAQILSDTSDGFNSSGEVTLLLARRHAALPIGPLRAHWLRCLLVEAVADQPSYHTSPLIESIDAVGLGGAVAAHHAEPAPAEVLGVSNGKPEQVFTVRRAPVLPRRPSETVLVTAPRRENRSDAPPERWQEVASFAEVTGDERVFTWSGATGEIRFGPRVVGRDGSVRQYGAVPPEDAEISVTGYRYGGGRRGNVGAGRLSVLLAAIPSVDTTVRNLRPATGGVDAESVDNAKLRGPLYLRGGHRAVTVEDFERLTLEAARGVGRARCLPPAAPGDPVRVLVVPRVDIDPDELTLQDLALPGELETQIKRFLDQRRLLTTRVLIDVPSYQGITVTAEVRAAPTVGAEIVRAQAESALYRFINPLVGGPDGRGWPFDFDLSIGDIFAVLRAVAGIESAETVRIFLADLQGREPPRETPQQRVALSPAALFMSVRHKVVVRQ